MTQYNTTVVVRDDMGNIKTIVVNLDQHLIKTIFSGYSVTIPFEDKSLTITEDSILKIEKFDDANSSYFS